MADHIDRAAFRNLKEAGRLAIRLGVNIQGRVNFRGALRGELGGAGGQQAQIRHLPLIQQFVHVGPTFDAGGGPHFHEPAPRLQHFQAVAVLGAGHGLRLGAQIAAQSHGGGAGVGDSGGGFGRRGGGAGAQQQEAEPEKGRGPNGQPMPRSSMRSSGDPQRRQIRDPQSPQAKGSRTGWRHWGQ